MDFQIRQTGSFDLPDPKAVFTKMVGDAIDKVFAHHRGAPVGQVREALAAELNISADHPGIEAPAAAISQGIKPEPSITFTN